MLNPLTYREMLRAVSLRALHCFEEALAGRDSQEGGAAPYRLPAAQRKEIRRHARAAVLAAPARTLSACALRVRRSDQTLKTLQTASPARRPYVH